MFRKSIIAVVAASAMAAAALSPTSAFAWHPHHHHWHHHYGWGGPALVAGAILGTAAIAAEEDSCYVRRWVDTPYGPRRVLFNVC